MPLDKQLELVNTLLTPMMFFMGVGVLILYLRPMLKQWLATQREHQAERLRWERARFEAEIKLGEQEAHLRAAEADRLAKSMNDQIAAPRDPGGYIVLDLPEQHRSLFLDLLKGFEDFALLRGYRVLFSFDSNSPDQVAFKFTISESGIAVSTERVKRDFEDYIARVRSGEPLDDLPVVISPEQHDLLVTTMKNRINFLQHNYNLTKNTAEYYERLLQAGGVGAAFRSAPTVVVQTGHGGRLGFDARSYLALDSPQTVQGDGNAEIVQQLDQGIRIAGSFNERQSQIADVERLLNAVRALPTTDDPVPREEVVVNLEKIKDELEHQDKPDEGRIRRWLEMTKLCLENLKLSKQAVETAKAVYTSFNVANLISHLSSF